MRRSSMFWGAVLILIGAFLTLDNLGALDFLGVSAWQLVWPLLLITFGGWVLWSASVGKPDLETKELTLLLEGATSGKVRIEHGAGHLQVSGSAPTGHLLTGSFDGGVEHTVDRSGEQVRLKLRAPWQSYGPWNWWMQGRRDWSLQLSDEIPLDLSVNSGASETHLDLTELNVTHLKVNTGASSTNVTLPARAQLTQATFEGGAASLIVKIPESVAGRIRTEGAIYDVKVDPQRFPRQGNAYQTPNFETAEHKAEITIKMGVGSVEIH